MNEPKLDCIEKIPPGICAKQHAPAIVNLPNADVVWRYFSRKNEKNKQLNLPQFYWDAICGQSEDIIRQHELGWCEFLCDNSWLLCLDPKTMEVLSKLLQVTEVKYLTLDILEK